MMHPLLLAPLANVVRVFRSGSTSIAAACCQSAGLEFGRRSPHNLAPKGSVDNGLPILASIRHPVVRFASSMGLSGLSFAQAVAQRDRNTHGHFCQQIDLLPQAKDVRLYRFPDQISDLFADAGLSGPDPDQRNRSPEGAAILDEDQQRWAREAYAADIDLFNSIDSAGMTFRK